MQEKKGWLNEIISFLLTLTISFIAVLLFTTYIAKPVRVEGSSMYPTLQNNDVAFSSLMNLEKNQINRFDIVVVRLQAQNKYVVKRVIGLPNETVEIKGDILYINGEEVAQDFLNEEYVASQSIHGIFTGDIEPITLGSDEFFLLGDNRPNSQDSRYYGPFQAKDIVSKHLLIIYPFHRMGAK